ncbi:MAG: flagellar hook-associated protein FlgL [Phaeobacter gallaeciensis]|jgi:flagellar hook-associated protein 3 FlgL
MSISTSLFHTLNTRSLSTITDRIASLQSEISSGKNDPRASADPVRALRLSAVSEQKDALDRFSTNVERVQSRLDQADIVLKEATNVQRRIRDLALRATSDTATSEERKSIGIEVQQLRQGLLGLANSRDETGQALFGGFQTRDEPFVDSTRGVVYRGDGGQIRLQVSESLSLPGGISGSDIFGGETGATVFDAIDDFLNMLGVGGSFPSDEVTSQDTMLLQPALARDPGTWSMTLAGPAGEVALTFEAAEGSVSGAVDAINAQTAATGISAVRDPESGGILLSATGQIGVSGVTSSVVQNGPVMQVTPNEGFPQPVVSADQTRASVIARLQAASDTIVDQRTRVGALSANASAQAEVIDTRKVMMAEATAQLEDLDLAAALTKLQQSLLTRDAAQQSYVKITQKSLFDYLR